MRIVGIEERTGEFKGRPFRFFNLHCMREDDRMIGQRVERVKVPGPVFDAWEKKCGCPRDGLLSVDVDFYYDRWNHVKAIIEL